MAPAPEMNARANPEGLHTSEPVGGTVMSVIICLVSISIISGFFGWWLTDHEFGGAAYLRRMNSSKRHSIEKLEEDTIRGLA